MINTILKYFFVIILLTCFCSEILSQEKSIQGKIKWSEKNYLKFEPNGNVNYLNYPGASYVNDENLLPYQVIKISIPDIKVPDKLEINILSTLPITIKTKFSGKEDISNKINLNQKIIYDEKQKTAIIYFVPVVKTANNQFLLVTQYEIKYNLVNDSKKSRKLNKNYASNSVLSSGTWYKIKIQNDGVYKLTYDELAAMGLGNSQGVRLFGYGGGMLPVEYDGTEYDDLVENAIYINYGSDGIFNSGDYILFYAQGPVKWNYNQTFNMFTHQIHYYSDASYYFLTTGTPKKIQSINSLTQPANKTVTSFDNYKFHELEQYNLIRSGKKWFGEKFDIYTQYDFSFSFPNIITSDSVAIRTSVVGRYSSSVNNNFIIKYNNQTIQNINISSVNMSSSTASYAQNSVKTAGFYVNSSNLPISVIYDLPLNTDAVGWLDFIELNARTQLKFYGPQMHFRDIRSVGTGNISDFILTNTTSSLAIWEITDPVNVKSVNTSYNSGSMSFRLATDSLRQFIAFDGTSFLKPENVGIVENQNLHGLGFKDFIIICPSEFLSYANDLASFHAANDNLSVAVVTDEQIYNEFSSGTPDIAAIRNFLKMFYDKATNYEQQPKYALLFGDGSYDNKTESPANTNLLLTYQSDNSLIPTSSYVTDDYFALLDFNDDIVYGNLDIGIGRLPVKNTTEAKNAVDKIKHYYDKETLGDWRNVITFVGDDEDGNTHMDQADQLAEKVYNNYPVYNIEKIFLDAYQEVSTPAGEKYPDVNRAVKDRITKGCLIFNYTGHGNEVGLAHEGILDVNDINSWENIDNLPVFVTATCEFSRFDDFDRTSAGELIFLSDIGGGIALFTTTRLVYSTPNFYLNKAFYDYVFAIDTNTNDYMHLGDIMKHTKNNADPGSTNKRNFTLLGDPALKIAIPKEDIATIKINNVQISTIPDTLKALSKVTISGQVQDHNGTLISSYNGILYPTVYDKRDSIITLGNGGTTPFTFFAQNKILYRGKASITNGLFEFSFIVPKDISYKLDYGKISYYAENKNNNTGPYYDANGYYSNIIIGGSSDSIAEDVTGPEIKLFMNDTNFVYGGITNEDPLMLAHIYDDNGINTVGNGIGHDIVATLDYNTNETYILNDYYEAEINSYQKGYVKYNFYDLDVGLHHLKLKVWDVYNNSAESEIEFVVAKSSELVLDHVLNYPNPFTTGTYFYFEHNQPDSQLDVLIQVFTITGKIVKTIETTVFTDGFRSEPIFWDGKDDFGDKIGRGVYVYRVKVRAENGNVVDKFEKLVILK
ncbi:MAG: type IX secretion system sortase PorU [Marinilabiliales bacterium]